MWLLRTFLDAKWSDTLWISPSELYQYISRSDVCADEAESAAAAAAVCQQDSHLCPRQVNYPPLQGGSPAGATPFRPWVIKIIYLNTFYSISTLVLLRTHKTMWTTQLCRQDPTNTVCVLPPIQTWPSALISI